MQGMTKVYQMHANKYLFPGNHKFKIYKIWVFHNNVWDLTRKCGQFGQFVESSSFELRFYVQKITPSSMAFMAIQGHNCND